MIRRLLFIFVMLIIFLAGCSKQEQSDLTNQNASNTIQQNDPENINSFPQKLPDSDPTLGIQNPSDSDQDPQQDSEQNDTQTALTDEERLLKPPGSFAGSNYDEGKVQAALDQLPSNLTADQYNDELLLLLAEDYRPYVTTFMNFDSEVRVDNERPEGKITLPESRKLHVSILLDASGSMKAQINGKSKMDSAKEAIQSFADQLPNNAEVSLRVYGHKGTGDQKDKQASCNSTEEIYHGQGDQTNQIKAALQGVKPSGWTPIANALKSVKEDINPETTDSVVYVVSDGIETCGGNPAQVAKELNQSKVKTVVNIIGFAVDNEGQKLLRQVAASGGGEFTSVNDDEALKNVLNKAYDQLRGEWTRWKEKGEGDANKQKEQKQGEINRARETMQGLANKENSHLLAALKYLETKNDQDFPNTELSQKVNERKGFAWGYARDTGKRLYEAVTKNGNQVYGDIKDEGNKNIDDLTNKTDR
ncbi:VWA domain-containing protein [Paenibacillus sp. XY044]|uniref:vWA domain-containing protein n=1 Tax=Paenibacillus sp. XY044 TaxID=2026089 RepID=UPI000B97D92D|nr:VWA domain-containing protein [Paenibacillus sp. XY044]OZB92432.1 amino acid dehydrogenase [Paenibacillus sp. XY044]